MVSCNVKCRLITAGLFTILFLVLVTPVAAVIIDFEGQTPAGEKLLINPYSEDGFTLSADTVWDITIYDSSYSPLSTTFKLNSNGTDIIGWNGMWSYPELREGPVTLTLAQDNGNPFSIKSLYASSLYPDFLDLSSIVCVLQGQYANCVGLDVIGYLEGGGTVSTSFNLTFGSWNTFYFGQEFSNLTSIEIFSSVYPSVDLAIDNLILDGRLPTVPVPPPLLLLGTGLIGLSGFMKKLTK